MELNAHTQHYLKACFKTLGYQVSIHKNAIEFNDKMYHVEEKPQHPYYTNEALVAMPLKSIYNRANAWGFNRNHFYPQSYEGFLAFCGFDRDNTRYRNNEAFNKARHILKRFIYCSPENHRPYVVMNVGDKEVKISDLLQTAVVFKDIPQLGEIGSRLVKKYFE